MHSSNLKSPLSSFPEEEGVTLLAPQVFSIPPGLQVILDYHVSYKLPDKMFMGFYAPRSLGQNEAHLCPIILDGELNESPHYVSNSMDQSKDKVKLQALSPN
ncbi:hypothetical protein DSO57_1025537 [Entomophthora muscae]|uniref:Uncharacterized protein n=1 Tax=Entomophthora muscae TaxID=34485 RepID=A0ACC2UC01_9FUNG|nr:hypothetical protein DSO57_1025537 [Entomophthora muscae]